MPMDGTAGGISSREKSAICLVSGGLLFYSLSCRGRGGYCEDRGECPVETLCDD